MSQETLLMQQGKDIANAITQQGYQVRHIAGSDLIAWEVSREEDNYWVLMAWLPRPVAQWRLLPVVNDDYQAELYQTIEQTIGGRR